MKTHSAATARTVSMVLGFSYPLLAHLAVIQDSRALTLTALGMLCLAMLLPALANGRWLAWLALLPLALTGQALYGAQAPSLSLYPAPILVPAFMAWVFGQTLTPTRTPLIAQLVQAMHASGDAPSDPAVWRYARRLTWVWTWLFVGISLANFVLGLLAEPEGLLLASGIEPPVTVPQRWWSLFANLIGYALVAAFFVAEYAYRRHRFPDQPYRNLYEFLRQVMRAMPRLVRPG